MPPPWTLDYGHQLREAWQEAQSRRLERSETADAEARQRRLQARSLAGSARFMNAVELEKHLPDDPVLMTALLADRNLHIGNRAKLLEVVLIRAGSYSLETLQQVANDATGLLAGAMLDKTPAAASACARYQEIAADAVLRAGGAELFKHLSRSDDAHPTSRAPATQLLHVLGQKGGALSDAAGQPRGQAVEEWIRLLPADVRGRAMFHLFDAGEKNGIGAGSRITGVELPFVGGAQWEGSDTHWAEVAGNVWLKVSRDLDLLTDEDRKKFYEGARAADPSHKGIEEARPGS